MPWIKFFDGFVWEFELKFRSAAPKGSSQRGALHIHFGRFSLGFFFFIPDALSDVLLEECVLNYS